MGARIELCGRLEVELNGQRVEPRLPGRQGPLVFALLVLNRDRPVARDELIEALWPATPPADPDEALSALLSKMRQAVGRETLTGRRELTLMLPAGAEVDFEQAIEVARSVGARAEEGHALNTLGVDISALGDRRRGIRHLREAKEIAEELGWIEEIGRAYVNLTAMIDKDGRLQESVDVALEGMEAMR